MKITKKLSKLAILAALAAPTCLGSTTLVHADDTFGDPYKLNTTAEYDGKFHKIINDQDGASNLTYGIAMTANRVVAAWSSTEPVVKDINTYYVWIEYAPQPGMNPKAGHVTITPRNLNINVNSAQKTFGDADPELTYTVDGLLAGDAVTGKLTREAGEHVGEYAIKQDSLGMNLTNYKVENFSQAKLTIAPTAKMNKFYTDLDATPAEIKNYDDVDKVVVLTNDWLELSNAEKDEVEYKIADVKEEIAEFQNEAGVVNHETADASIAGQDLPWNYRLVTEKIGEDDTRFTDFLAKLTGEKLDELFDIHLIDLLDGDNEVEPHALEKVTLKNVDLSDEKDLKLHHDHGTFEDLAITFDDVNQTLSFETEEFSEFGISTLLASGPAAEVTPVATPSAVANIVTDLVNAPVTEVADSAKATDLPHTGEMVNTSLTLIGAMLSVAALIVGAYKSFGKLK
ncbi:MAG: LPXTG cell wall anchor domain-containing protein [Lactobacillales bacterium]|jgi:LPXTG-motif cell wall-anchored protein|nr:LPXTG cell wall anchor domain-containing protein [Lactobacillales bacterium]